MHSVTPSAHALLTGTIDYAGLFPPANLQLGAALRNYAEYIRSDDAWMLSTFVLPVAKFAEAVQAASEFNPQHPLRISALGPKTATASDFAQELTHVIRDVRELETGVEGAIRPEQLEMALPSDSDEVTLPPIPSELTIRSFWEAPAKQAEAVMAALATQRPAGFKLRTGGVIAAAFPTSAQIARVLVASARHKVPIKFTAGLHHPVRMFRDEVKAKMHGFLNVLGAGVFAHELGWNEGQTATMLEDEDASAFRFTPDAFHWRDFAISTAAIARQREFITSFGSCSFDEPRDDLRALSLL